LYSPSRVGGPKNLQIIMAKVVELSAKRPISMNSNLKGSYGHQAQLLGA